MKKIVLVFSSLFSMAVLDANAQCTVEAFPDDTITLTCGDEIEIQLSAFGISGNFAINNDFNTGTPGTGWDQTSAATYTNPCVDSPDGSIYLWMGDATPQPRTLTTQSFDLSTGGTICYEMRYSVQAEASSASLEPLLPDASASASSAWRDTMPAGKQSLHLWLYADSGGTTWP